MSRPSSSLEDVRNGVFDFGKKGLESTLSITVVGASGDLAKKKIFPALFALYYEDCLPEVNNSTQFQSFHSLNSTTFQSLLEHSF